MFKGPKMPEPEKATPDDYRKYEKDIVEYMEIQRELDNFRSPPKPLVERLQEYSDIITTLLIAIFKISVSFTALILSLSLTSIIIYNTVKYFFSHN
jgi:hypothetical protein